MKALNIKDLSPKFVAHAFSTDIYAAIEDALYDTESLASKKDYAILETHFYKIMDSKKLDFLDDQTHILTLLGNKVYTTFKGSYEH